MAARIDRKKFSGGFAKVLEEQWHVDVQLKAGDSVEGSTISAHKLVLAARSEVFKKMFESDKCKASLVQETVTLSEMTHEEVNALVEFMYSSGSVLSTEVKKNVRSLYIAADKYEIPHLRNLCRNELISSLNSSNGLDILELAQIPFDEALHNAAYNFIKNNIHTIVYSDDFKVFMVSNPDLTLEVIKDIIDLNLTTTNVA